MRWLVRWLWVAGSALAAEPTSPNTLTPAEIKAKEKFQADMFGSDLFPTLPGVQKWVFESSFTGPWIKQDLGFLLIDSTRLEPEEPTQQKHANRVPHTRNLVHLHSSRFSRMIAITKNSIFFQREQRFRARGILTRPGKEIIRWSKLGWALFG